MTPFLPILVHFFQGPPHLAYYCLVGLYSRLNIWQIFLFIETLLLYFPSSNNLWTFLKVIAFSLETSGKIQFWFIQERWIYFLVKNRNSEIFFSPNIMTFDKLAQKMYFYLLVASLYLIRSKSKIFVYSFISCWLPCPHEWFQVFALMNDFLNDLHFRI